MKTTVAAIAVLGLLATLGAAPAAGQPRWDSMDIAGGGKQFQLSNDEGAAIVLLCLVNGQAVGFQFPEPIESTDRAHRAWYPRGAGERPGRAGQRSVAAGHRCPWARFHAGLLQTASRLSVRASGQNADFEVFGSNSTSVSASNSRRT